MTTYRAIETNATLNDKNICASALDRMINCCAVDSVVARADISNSKSLVRRSLLAPIDHVETRFKTRAQNKTARNWDYFHSPSCRKREYDDEEAAKLKHP
jgi:hypothetical protein